MSEQNFHIDFNHHVEEINMTMTPYILNLVIAMCLGALIGAERQWRQRMAGLRTNALVATGAAVFYFKLNRNFVR
ncbi:putative protein MgtC [Proteus penneri ATCC 35198]|nr:putative protein MgtC [Proteus penneri ATCC 35198]